MFVLCILLPPLAALLAGGIMSALFNLVLTACLWIPGVIHAFMVVNNAKAEKRNEKLIRETRKQTEEMVAAMKKQDEAD